MSRPTAVPVPHRSIEAAVRVAVLDDHPVVRAGLRATLTPALGLLYVGGAPDEHALWPLLHRVRPDVLLLDLHHPGRDGLILTSLVAALVDGPRVVLHPAAPTDAIRLAAALAGAVGKARLRRPGLLLPRVRPAGDARAALRRHVQEHPARPVRHVHRPAVDAPRLPRAPGYLYWSLTDNYEWGSYAARLGLYTVDVRTDPTLRRRPTAAVPIYRRVIRDRGAPATFTPTTEPKATDCGTDGVAAPDRATCRQAAGG